MKIELKEIANLTFKYNAPDTTQQQENIFKKHSSLRLKTISVLVVMFILLVCFCLAILLTSFFLIFHNVERVESTQSSRRVSRALFDDLKLLSDRTFEYGSFDSTTELVNGASQETIDQYMSDYMNCDYLNRVNVNMALFYYLNGTMLRGIHCFKGVSIEGLPSELTNLDQETVDGQSNEYRKFFINNLENPSTRHIGLMIPSKKLSELATSETSQQAVSNYSSILSNVLLVNAMPIQGYDSLESFGMLTFAKYNTYDYLLDISERTQFCVTTYDLKSEYETSAFKLSTSNAISDSLDAITSEWIPTNISSTNVYSDWTNDAASLVKVIDIGKSSSNSDYILHGRQCSKTITNKFSSFSAGSQNERMAAYQMYNDITGGKTVVFRTDIQRSSFQVGMASFLVVWFVMTFFVLVLSAGVVIFIESSVLRRILKLSKSVRDFYESGNDFNKTIPQLGHDEIGTLSSKINQMLASLKKNQEKLVSDMDTMQEMLERTSIQEQSNRCIMNSINEFIAIVEKSTGLIVNTNSYFDNKLVDSNENQQQVNYLHDTIDKFFKETPLDELLQKFAEISDNGIWKTNIFSITSKQLPVQLKVYNVRLLIKEGQVSDAFVIVAINLSEENELQQSLQDQETKLEEMKKILDFNRIISDDYLKSRFLQLCPIPNASKYMAMIEKLETYKLTNKPQQRAKLHKKIVESYLIDQNNISNLSDFPRSSIQTFNTEAKKAISSLAHFDVFEKIEVIVKLILINLAYTSFMENIKTILSEKPSSRESTMSSTSSSFSLGFEIAQPGTSSSTDDEQSVKSGSAQDGNMYWM
ncbi:predicted protein [Naegleria gruberi]|uniref:Predicted protein n=1 Tax=Naegleria gruberi TaxID=5762 RepID=D2W421_NAEGR|nr:uncharacterized protein NAEGRDRAFT_76151 [Naegleria gruberi]EFC36184.1 predicted protein [Naegleria gruberi]|eukprot:XP_002668928.1 predicted protein [Naegleria gruberi strain NEG-M]